MSKLVVEKSYFENRAAVLEDIRDTGYWPTTFVSNQSPELPLHYHDHDIIGYVIEGETYMLAYDFVVVDDQNRGWPVVRRGGDHRLPPASRRRFRFTRSDSAYRASAGVRPAAGSVATMCRSGTHFSSRCFRSF